MKLILNNKIEYNVFSVFGKKKIINDKQRDYLEILIDLENNSIDEINNNFSNKENTKSITLINKNNDEIESEYKEEIYVHNDYVILDEITIKDYVLSKETNEQEAQMKKVICIGLGRITFSEKLILNNKQDLEDITVILGDLLGGKEYE